MKALLDSVFPARAHLIVLRDVTGNVTVSQSKLPNHFEMHPLHAEL